MSKITSSTKDYLYTLEGTAYARTVIKRELEGLNDTFGELNSPSAMQGDTAKEYVTRLASAVSVVEAIIKKFDTFADKIQSVCEQNNAQVNGSMLDNFDNAMKALNAHEAKVQEFNGKK